ncbi:hypothetical protein N8I71_17225 [Roseibacterium sp. SDUM158016]|uniref:hypothetical protein n=1 Tax=Roseicyclus sediminis TaxID=2980997 RepID=UPI0021D3454F|nr:hypothetical protein [Roseibacterium sp. SDUM158016]MCU4654584.1 hypothetical protein [Roseibacterium sp. SDUM158016]
MRRPRLQNRVLPTGEIVADPARGLFTGNRGILHRPDGTFGTSRWAHKHWIVCTLTHPRGTYHGPMPARGWTALFFLDEAVALAAGHRPCAECRREAFLRFREAWSRASGEAARAPGMDEALHRARVLRTRAQKRHEAPLAGLPDGTFVLKDGRPCLVLGDALLPFSPGGYGVPLPRREGRATVLTPAPAVAALRAGYAPVLHPSAFGG